MTDAVPYALPKSAVDVTDTWGLTATRVTISPGVGSGERDGVRFGAWSAELVEHALLVDAWSDVTPQEQTPDFKGWAAV